MSPILTLFHKELRQHGAFALAMVFLGLIFQIAYAEGNRFFGFGYSSAPNGGTLLSLAIFVTVLYAGAAAAFAYSTEHSENTFGFLQKLPISWITAACGKVGWVLCGTVLVLLGNLMLFFLGAVLYGATMHFDGGQVCLAVGIGIVEAFVWGLFWSTRCRSQIHAFLATCISASVTLYVVTYFFAVQSDDAFGMYAEVVPHRLAAAGIVALAAVWGMSRWFYYEGKRPFVARLYPEKITVRYPQKVQQPFSALIHHHLRHASILYPLGVLGMAMWSGGWLVACLAFYLPEDVRNSITTNTGSIVLGFFLVGGVYCTPILMGLFWATIFGHDQKKDSYRFLSRLGIPDGAIWWSRILPAMIFYVPVIASVAVFFFLFILPNAPSDERGMFWSVFWSYAPLVFVPWLALPAVGAFFSISFRSQMVTIALTTGCVFLPILWMGFFFGVFGCSPWWTTVPICVALLLASRIRAAYWLRETFTWRSRIIPLVPLFATMLAIVIALPFVRVYSVPYISWTQMDAYFDAADLGDIRRAPEQRKALLRHIAEHGSVPPEYDTWLAKIGQHSTYWELNAFNDLTAEEYLLLRYVERRNEWKRTRHENWHSKDQPIIASLALWLSYSPWETARRERLLWLPLVAELVESGGLQDRRAVAIRDRVKRQTFGLGMGAMDLWNWHWRMPDDMDAQPLCDQQLHLTFKAIEKWYAEHDTLPESLDELVDGGYLSALPVHPFTGERMQYHRDSPAPTGVERNDISSQILGSERWISYRQTQELRDAFFATGGTYLQLGKWIHLVVRSQEEGDRNQEEDNEPRTLESE